MCLNSQGTLVDSSLCEAASKPAEFQTCNNNPCVFFTTGLSILVLGILLMLCSVSLDRGNIL